MSCIASFENAVFARTGRILQISFPEKVLLISASPTEGGRGDKILGAAQRGAASAGAETSAVYLRDCSLSPCLACDGCAEDGVCVQDDDMKNILAAMHDADAVLFAVPVYYNYMAAQAVILLDRLYCTCRYGDYKLGKEKKVCVFLTCEGSEKALLKRQIDDIMDLGSIRSSVSEYKTEVFRACEDDFGAFLQSAEKIGEWAAE